jgi:penicillin amidase
MALAWPALRADDQTAAALYGFSKAVDWPSFLQAAESFHSPQQTILYADRAGTIAMVAPGRVPIRKRGDGSVPVPGWTGDYDWTGFIPFEELPMRVDPPNGRIVTANNRLVPKSYPYLLTRDWPDPYRAERIEESLEGGFGFDVDSTMVLQNDSLSTAARELVPRLLALLPADAGLADIRRALGGWDYGMQRDRPEPLIFYGWLWALNGALLGDELRQDFPDFARPDPRLIARTLSEGQAWCDIQRTEPVETCPAAVAAALSQAVAVLSDAYGSDWRAWRWGDAHRVTFRHDVWSRVPLLGSLLGRSLPTDGGDFTVNRGGVRFGAGRTPDFEDVLVPSLRAVYDLADLDNSRFMIAGGQSGHPLSPHYGDLLESWRDGLYVKLVGAETEATQRLVLLPQ